MFYCWNFPDISGGIETYLLVFLISLPTIASWNFPDISGGIETLAGRSNYYSHYYSWNFPDISGGIETLERLKYGSVALGVMLEFPRHQWWD